MFSYFPHVGMQIHKQLNWSQQSLHYDLHGNTGETTGFQ